MSTDYQIARDRYLEMLSTAMGPQIMQLMDDDSVIEIMLNPDGKIFVERLKDGKQLTEIKLKKEQAENIVKLVASYKNEVADVKSPMVATEIPFHGARFQGWLPPVVDNPCFSIRKRALQVFSLDDYQKSQTISLQHAELLKKSVLERRNIIVVGGTSSGKTTFANALLQVLAGSDDRVLVLEDLPELQVAVQDLVTLNTTPDVSMQTLVKGSLRMRPDRIVIGEVRDGAALDLLKAWNTGHPGGVCTLHANSAESAPYRLEDLIQEVTVKVPTSLIMQAVDLIVFLERQPAGARLVKTVAELTSGKDGSYQLREL